MMEIIPAINAENWETVQKRIALIAPYTEWVHLDVADGTFTHNITWHRAEDLKSGVIPQNVRIETHLMVAEPQQKLEPWIQAGVRRVILHWEALRPKGIFKRSARKNLEAVSKFLQENWVEFGISVLFRTNPREIEPYIGFIDMVQVLAVEPGLAGQVAHPEAIAVVREVRRMINAIKPHVKIEVDGGINSLNIKDYYLAGANIAAAASSIFGATEPHLALEALKRAVLG